MTALPINQSHVSVDARSHSQLLLLQTAKPCANDDSMTLKHMLASLWLSLRPPLLYCAGSLRVQTEMGVLHVVSGEICVVQRGIRFRVGLLDDATAARGYVLEVYNAHFVLPELGPIGDIPQLFPLLPV